MTKTSTYGIDRIERLSHPLPILGSEREAVFQLSDTSWRLMFHDSGRCMSCGLLRSKLEVEYVDSRTCRLSVTGDDSDGFQGAVVLIAPARKVKADLAARKASLEHAGKVVAAVQSGSWWWDARVFDGLDWSERCSVAGVRYRAGWWGTGRISPSMLPKVLDFGPHGIVLRGWRVRLVIPWDTVAGVEVTEGEWRPASEPATGPASKIGASVIIRSHAGQDAVFWTSLVSAARLRDTLRPLTGHLAGALAS